MKPLSRKPSRYPTFLVRIVRTLRRTKLAWEQVGIELDNDKEYAVMLSRRQNLIDSYLNGHRITKLQLGSGIYPLEGWLNSDMEPVADDIIFLDATEQFPFPDHTFDYVFAEHMIEHITYPQALNMMAEIGRVLKPGGKVRLATPDLRVVTALFDENKGIMAREYIDTQARELLGLYSPETSGIQRHEPRWNIDYRHILTHFPEPSRDSTCFVVNLLFYAFGHQFLYDLPTLEAVLRQNGFTNIVSIHPGESDDEHLRGIERHGLRFSQGINRFQTMVVEASH